jgi:hypothetical protein
VLKGLRAALCVTGTGGQEIEDAHAVEEALHLGCLLR